MCRQIVKHDDFLQLPKELLLQAVRSPCLKAESEEQIWDAVLRWGRHQCADDAADDDDESEEDDTTVDKKNRDKGKEKVGVKRNEKEKKKEKEKTTMAGRPAARWERGVNVAEDGEAEEAARKARAEREKDEEQRISHALKTRVLPEFIPFIRYPLMNYAFLCGACGGARVCVVCATDIKIWL
jgi:hypothetical protein